MFDHQGSFGAPPADGDGDWPRSLDALGPRSPDHFDSALLKLPARRAEKKSFRDSVSYDTIEVFDVGIRSCPDRVPRAVCCPRACA